MSVKPSQKNSKRSSSQTPQISPHLLANKVIFQKKIKKQLKVQQQQERKNKKMLSSNTRRKNLRKLFNENLEHFGIKKFKKKSKIISYQTFRQNLNSLILSQKIKKEELLEFFAQKQEMRNEQFSEERKMIKKFINYYTQNSQKQEELNPEKKQKSIGDEEGIFFHQIFKEKSHQSFKKKSIGDEEGILFYSNLNELNQSWKIETAEKKQSYEKQSWEMLINLNNTNVSKINGQQVIGFDDIFHQTNPNFSFF